MSWVRAVAIAAKGWLIVLAGMAAMIGLGELFFLFPVPTAWGTLAAFFVATVWAVKSP